ncbi:hypothetical protein B296_00038619 [Ensete ventricosum]|uniref:Uncharacterized protein n=1 Tax=Ensete ventricosum TaxID=4639 RepID=A0A426ZVV2_ENSVE|nr:hypothetical protein B296_00038619 [Ensete ventricosum]
MKNKDQAFLLNLIGLKSQAIDHMNHDQGSTTPTSMKGNALQTSLANIKGTLSGETTIHLTLQFLRSMPMKFSFFCVIYIY